MEGKEKCVDNTEKSCYSCIDIDAGGESMTSSEIVRELINTSEKQQKEVAAAMNWSASSLSCRVKRGTLLADDFFKILEILGYEVKIVKTDSGEEMEARKRGVGKRLKGMVNGIKYDTYKADAICHSEETDGMFLELYRNTDGTYFVANYVNWEGGESFISPIGKEDAEKLIGKYAE